MCARAGAGDVLLAYQPVGPNARRFVELKLAFPQTTFACLLDDFEPGQALSQIAIQQKTKANFLLDLDCGQHRTGVTPDLKAAELYQNLCRLPGLDASGFHAYDGHIHASDRAQREAECEAAFAPVIALREKLLSRGQPVKTVVAGGTLTFPFHAHRPAVECSPGTTVLWDWGYSSRFPDLDFLHAALVLTRVISKSCAGKLCLDLGHKAIASENPHPRVHFLNAPSARAIAHSEEHLVVESEDAWGLKVGDCLFGVPWHICPTVALHSDAVIVRNRRAVEHWTIAARARHLTY